MSKAQEAATVREKAAKELLDTEIDFHQKQQAGEDTEALKAKLDSLKVQVTLHLSYMYTVLRLSISL